MIMSTIAKGPLFFVMIQSTLNDKPKPWPKQNWETKPSIYEPNMFPTMQQNILNLA